MASAISIAGFTTIPAATSPLADGEVGGTTSPWSIVIVGLVMIVVAAVTIACVTIPAQRRDRVRTASAALIALDDLNVRSRPLMPARETIRLHFGATVDSKSRFDRFNLRDWMESSLLEHEDWITQEVNARLADNQRFVVYDDEFQAIARTTVGKSSHPKIKADRFNRIENTLFHNQKLPYPQATAAVTGSVTYTSPKGQNSYTSRIDCDFNQLRQGLRAAQTARALQSTVQARRARERSLMTPGLRMTILKRDRFRCQMCGASAPNGATLHIDHITPVSLGGLTTPENLQALCDTCNLGKSNRFVG